MSSKELTKCKNWIFDMDGTLTIAQHDFDAIRDELGLEKNGLPILESLAQLPENESASLHIKLAEIELEIAHQAKPAKGANDLLDNLSLRGVNLGILTRNNGINVKATLKATGLLNYFPSENIMTRDCIAPKPSPAGILKLLDSWGMNVDDAVMVGDHLHDLRSGRAANVTTVYIDPSEEYPYRLDADICIKQLTELYVK